MNINPKSFVARLFLKRTEYELSPRCRPSFFILWGLMISLASLARAVTVDVTLSFPGTVSLPAKIYVAVSTFPVKDPTTAFSPSVYLTIKSSITNSSASEQFIFNGLPMSSNPTVYHFYGYIDSNLDGVMGSTEPRGGYGPFPNHQASALFLANSVGDTGTATLFLSPRASISGNVSNLSPQAGQRVIVRAMEDMGAPDPDKAQEAVLAIYGGNYTLTGLEQTGNSYRVEAWIDTEIVGSAGRGEWNSYEDGNVVYPAGTLLEGESRFNQDITIVSGTVGGSAPDHIRLSGSNGGGYQVIGAGFPSSDLKVSLRDASDVLTSTPTATQVYLSAYDSGGGLTPEISTDTVNFYPWVSPLVLPGGMAETLPFRFRYPSAGHVTLRAEAVSFPTVSESRYAWYDFDVISGTVAFTNLRARTASQPAVTTGTAVTITPDRDGMNDGAVFSCVPPPGASNWELLVSSDPSFGSGVVSRIYGFGTNDAYWHGNGTDGRTVPNGIYYVRYQTSGQGIVSSTLIATVQASGIKGVVMSTGALPLSEVEVNVYGAGGGSSQRTASDGSFFVNGLKSLSSYQVELRKTGFITVSFSTPTGFSGNPAVDLGTATLSSGVTLAVQVAVPSASTRDVYGNVNIHTNSYTENQWGPIHIASGSTLSDNGRYAGDPLFGPHTLISVSPNVSYTVEVNLPDFGRSTQTVMSPSAGVANVSFNMTRKANVSGNVQFPAVINSPYSGEWVSVDATPLGAKMPTSWGGGYVSNGQSGGVYQLFGLSGGTYALRAFVRGHVPSTTSVTVGINDVAGVDFPIFTTGGQITGTVTVLGNSSLLLSANSGGPSCPSGFPVNLNATSRVNYTNAFGQVCLSTSATSTSGAYTISGLADGAYELFSYLPGFESLPSGPQQVTVAGGSGTKNLTFQALTGQVNIQGTLPNGDTGSLVRYELTKAPPNSINRSGVMSGSPLAVATESNLGTGLYRLTIKNDNPGRGLVQETALAVTNGLATTVPVDMTIPSYGVSGSLSVQGNIVLPSTWSVTVSSVPGLAAAGVTPRINVYALPLPSYYQDSFRPVRSVDATVYASSASYHIPALAPGGYLLRVTEDLNPSSASCSGCMAPPGLPEFASNVQLIFIGTGAPAGADLTLTDGAKVSGTILRPSGDSSTDALQFRLYLRRADNLSFWGLSVMTAGTGQATYAFPHLAAGDYILEVSEEGTTPRYAAQSVPIKVANGDLSVDISLSQAGTLVGRLRDADTQTLLTADNASQFLPDNFEIAAQANPWVPGGYIQALRNTQGQGFAFDATTGQFRISRLIPGFAYDLRLRGFSSLEGDALARGVRTYAPTVVSGIQVANGQIIDVGTLDLKQGGVLTGTVRDSAGTVLPNVRVTARPSQNNGGDRGNLQIETLTQGNGKYELHGVDRSKRFYDITAAPRFDRKDSFARLSGPRYAEERRRRVDVNDSTKLIGNDFTLSLANGVLAGTVVPIDQGILIPVFTDDNSQSAERGADIVLHREGTPFDDSPLGEIEERSNPDGTFRVEGLKPGAYTLRVLALGYTSALKSIVVPAGTVNAGEIPMGKGARVSGVIAKPDGSAPSINEVRMVLGVDENFEEFVFGTVDSNQDTQLVAGYSISGFRTGKSYSLVIVTAKDDILEAQTGVSFTDSSEEREIPLLFRPAPPHVFVNQAQSVSGANRVTALRFFVSQPLRNATSGDNDLAGLLQVTAGGGTLTDVEINSSRETITAVYTAPLSETSFDLRTTFFSTEKDPESPTGGNFQFDKTFTFFSGIAARRSASISNVTGGECGLEGVTTGVAFLAGSFAVGASSSVEVGLQSADALDALPAGAPRRARAVAAVRSAQSLGAKAYPSPGLFRAISAAPAVSAFSPFYDIFLPAGVNHLLKKEALLSLAYDADAPDPSKLNVYFYDPIHNVFLLENAKKTIDTVNHTITVSVSHLSTFVILPSQASIIGTDTFTGVEIQVHNVPNPFNLKSKTVRLTQANAPDQTQAIEGTLIRYSLPQGKSGEAKIEIYDVTGTFVRSLSQSAPSGGTYYYVEWDGRNDDGKKVASGVYLARFTLNGGDEQMFKMAVLK